MRYLSSVYSLLFQGLNFITDFSTFESFGKQEQSKETWKFYTNSSKSNQKVHTLLAPATAKITLKGNNESFGTLKQEMMKIDDKTREIVQLGKNKNLKVLHPGRSTPQNITNLMSHKKRSESPGLKQKASAVEMKKRLIHILALGNNNLRGLQRIYEGKFQNGTFDNERQSLVKEIAFQKGTSWALRKTFYNEIDINWPYYNPSEKREVSKFLQKVNLTNSKDRPKTIESPIMKKRSLPSPRKGTPEAKKPLLDSPPQAISQSWKQQNNYDNRLASDDGSDSLSGHTSNSVGKDRKETIDIFKSVGKSPAEVIAELEKYQEEVKEIVKKQYPKKEIRKNKEKHYNIYLELHADYEQLLSRFQGLQTKVTSIGKTRELKRFEKRKANFK